MIMIVQKLIVKQLGVKMENVIMNMMEVVKNKNVQLMLIVHLQNIQVIIVLMIETVYKILTLIHVILLKDYALQK